MKSSSMLEGEELVMESTDETLALTNYRVIYEGRTIGVSNHISIPLKKIASCSAGTQSKPVLLAIAAIALLIAIAAPKESAGIWPALGISIGFAVFYMASRSGVIKITSSGGEAITVPTKGMQHEQIMRFIKTTLTQITK